VKQLFHQKKDTQEECLQFLGAKFLINMTSAQLMYNMRQKHQAHMLTFDMRSRASYH
jgi:hypothetical protein